MSIHELYCYGTLRPGKAEIHHVPGRLYNLGWFPGIALDEPLGPHTGYVVCERITVDDTRLADLDRYEGYDSNDLKGSLYIRTPYRGGWIYVYNHPENFKAENLIPDGDWLRFRGEKQGRAA